jgi:uncharacterized protein (DUF2267 family)
MLLEPLSQDEWSTRRPLQGVDLMDAREFYRKVADRTVLSKEEAADLTRATFETLAHRVSAGEVRDLAGQLPEQLAEAIRRNGKSPERFGLDELIQRVSKRTGLNEAETTAGVRAVLLTLREAVEETEFNNFMSQLPGEFTRLLEPAA